MMSKTRYCLIYILFLIGALTYGSWFIAGPITVRHIVTLLMFIVCIYEKRGLYIDSYMKYFLFFVSCFMISSIATDYTAEGLRRFLGYYFVSYVGVFSTYLLISKYNAEKVFFYTICIIGVLDAIVTIGQLTMSPFIKEAVSVMRWDLALNDNLENDQSRSNFGLGFGLPGIWDIVPNACYLMFTSILSVASQAKKYNVLGLSATVLLLVACFIVQERSSFYLAVAFVFFLLWFISTKKKNKISRAISVLLTVAGICYVLANGSDWIASTDTRMSDMESLTGRDWIWNNVFEYIGNYPLLAGYDQMMAIYHKDGHNLILNAYVFGGLFGFIAIMLLLIKQFVFMFKTCMMRRKTISVIAFILACTYVAFTVNSLFHNLSIVYGTLEAWLLWAAFYSMMVRDKRFVQ